MGRRKSYDRAVLLGKAMEVFRDHGFAGTSADAVEELGVNRFSLYAEFGRAGPVRRGAQRMTTGGREELWATRGTRRGIDEIRALLEFFGSAQKSPAWGRGCLSCNTAVEFGPEYPSGAHFIQRYFDRVSSSFLSALENARNNGELCNSVIPEKEAGFFTASVLGMFVMLRAKAPVPVIQGAAQVAIEHLEAIRA